MTECYRSSIPSGKMATYGSASMTECYRSSIPPPKKAAAAYGPAPPVFSGPVTSEKGPVTSEKGPTTSEKLISGSARQNGYDAEIERKIASGELIVMNQHEYEKEIVVPRRRVIEEIIEKTVVVPQVVRREEVGEERYKVKEKIIEVGERPKIVEIPEIEYVEKIIEVPERKIKEIVKTVPIVQIKEELKYVPKNIVKEKIIETTDSDYEEGCMRDNKYRHIAPAETVKGDQILVSEPRPVHCTSYLRYRSCDINPISKQTNIPIYVPRFIEFPLYIDEIDQNTQKAAREITERVHMLANSGAPSLAELEKTAEYAKIFYQKIKVSPKNKQEEI